MAGIGIEKLVSLNTLVFSSLEFLFWYLPLFLLFYYLLPKRFRFFVLFAGSMILYGLGEPKYVFLLLGMSVINYLFGRYLERPQLQELAFYGDTIEDWDKVPCLEDADKEDGSHKNKYRLWFWLAVLCNAGILIYFKISNAVDENFLLPVGISFYIFKSISYLVDVYRQEIAPARSYVKFAGWLCCFPQIVSGPIMRYQETVERIERSRLSLTKAEAGLKKLIFGLAAKVLIADRLGILWNDIQTIGFESISTPLAWLGAAAFSLQLYFDFAGYSMMAVGIGQMLGMPVIKNFDRPYASRSISEFYRRWHMTLGSWFRDYIYIPLGGNRKGMGRTLLNLSAVWLLTGFWHGNSMNFVVWGLVLGFLIINEKLWLGKILKKWKIFSHIYVLFMIPLTWVIFAIPTHTEICLYFSRLFPFFGGGTAVNPADFAKELGIFAPTLVIAVLFSIPAVGEWFEKHKNDTFMVVALFILFWLCVYQMAIMGNNPFMYANF